VEAVVVVLAPVQAEPLERVLQITHSLYLVPSILPVNNPMTYSASPMKYILPALLSSSVLFSAVAAVPENSDYRRDTQSTYNQDATGDVFSFASAVSCFIKSMAPEQMIRRGTEPYLARVDANKCDNPDASGSTDGATTTTPRFMDAWVIPGIDSSGALTAKVYLSGATDEGKTEYTLVYARVRNGVAEAPPNGQWRVDFCANTSVPNSSGLPACDYGLGYADIDTGALTIFGQESRTNANGQSGLITYSAPKTGTGFTSSTRMRNSVPSTQEIRVAFNPSRYLVATSANSESETAICFDPSRDNPGTKFSVWNNFFYDATTGQKINSPNQGFMIATESRSQNSGFVSYNGVNFWDDVPASDKLPGKKVTGNGKTYTIGVANGVLERISKSVTTLSTLETPFKFNFSGNGNATARVFAAISSRSLQNGEGVSFIGNWNNSTSSFEIRGFQICGTGNCNETPLSATRSFTLTELVASPYLVTGFGGWQDGTGVRFNGRLTNDNGSVVTGSARVTKEISRRVSPGDTSIGRLSCIDNSCPYLDGNNIQQINNSNNWPVRAADVKTFQWNPATGVPNYVKGDVLGEGGQVITTPVFATHDPNSSVTRQVRLFPTENLSQLACTRGGQSGYCSDRIHGGYEGAYYEWRTNARWTQNVYLKDDSNNGQIVNFEPPLAFTYTVPTNPPIGVDSRYAGKKILLQSPGQGQIWFPSHCVSTATGDRINCDSTDPSKQWVTDVYIPTVEGPDGMVTLLDSNGAETSTKYLVKWSNRGAVLAKADSCPGLILPTRSGIALPTIAGWQDPSNPSSPTYLGQPWVNFPPGTLPKVIHGVVQP
jgi:hypothetical protein